MSTPEEVASDWNPGNGVTEDPWWRVINNQKRVKKIQTTVMNIPPKDLRIYDDQTHQHSKLMFMYVTMSNTYFLLPHARRLLYCKQRLEDGELVQKDMIIMVRVYWTIHSNESCPCFVVRLLHTLNPPNLDMEEFCTTRNSRRIAPKRLFFTTKQYPFEQNTAESKLRL